MRVRRVCEPTAPFAIRLRGPGFVAFLEDTVADTKRESGGWTNQVTMVANREGVGDYLAFLIAEGKTFPTADEAAAEVRRFVETIVVTESDPGFGQRFALAALALVDWRELVLSRRRELIRPINANRPYHDLPLAALVEDRDRLLRQIAKGGRRNQTIWRMVLDVVEAEIRLRG